MRLADDTLRQTRVAIVVATAFAIGCAGTVGAAGGQTQAPAPTSAQTLAGALTTAQLAGQRVIYSYKGETPPALLLQRIRAGEAAGVIFFADNIGTRKAFTATIRGLQAAAGRSPVPAPLLLMTDQEGGEVRRLAGQPTRSQAAIGASTQSKTLAADAGTGAAANLSSYGLNVNLAPVADVARSASGFDGQSERSYGPDFTTDATLVAAFVKAQQAGGVAATLKHFPGLGTAKSTQDTDATAVQLNAAKGTLRATDEPPFSAGIAAGADLVMLSWARYPALDAARPAGLSRAVVAGELRGRLGFRGVTITDALTAGALARFGNVAARGLRAAQAGEDLVLATNTTAQPNTLTGVAVAAKLTAAITSGALDRTAARAAVARIIALRQTLATSPPGVTGRPGASSPAIGSTHTTP